MEGNRPTSEQRMCRLWHGMEEPGRLRFPNENGSCKSGHSLRLKVGELVTITGLIRFQETGKKKKVLCTKKTFFSSRFYKKFIINKYIFHGNWETDLSRISWIYFRIVKALVIYLAMLENPL